MSETAEYDDLAELLTKRQRIRPNRLSYALGLGLVLVFGFLGGAFAAKQAGLTNAATTQLAGGFTASFPGSAETGAGAGSVPAGGSAPAGSGTSQEIEGVVTLVDGAKVYVTAADGAVFIVTVPDSASVVVEQAVDLAGLEAGSQVTVTGSPGAEGAVTATRITTVPGTAQPADTDKEAGK